TEAIGMTGPLPTSDEFWLKALELGGMAVIALALLSLFASLLVWGCKTLYKRLFAEETGLVTVLINDQRKFVNSVDRSVKKATTAVGKLARNEARTHRAINELVACVTAHQASKEEWVLIFCKVLEKVAVREGVDPDEIHSEVTRLRNLIFDARRRRAEIPTRERAVASQG